MPQIGIETEIAQHIDSFILIEKSKWNVKYFLEGCELEDISDKISIYLKSLEAIAEDKSANEQRNCLQDIEGSHQIGILLEIRKRIEKWLVRLRYLLTFTGIYRQ
ncbi:unnamed protein product [Rhizophagus irregularis]|uniref:Uncharacterized protein n=1 Tax=Rhizophagus irregularis TaxID=588596 RepID=A0A916EGP4_9GLOM|nr:unnamed protein product [Rhizophagus irregularis]